MLLTLILIAICCMPIIGSYVLEKIFPRDLDAEFIEAYDRETWKEYVSICGQLSTPKHAKY